jgi:peptidoglycan/xylan/chitin deacetylase (PgdA/CDA1 family)
MRIIFFFLPLFLWADGHIFLYHRFDDFRHPYTNTSTKELLKNFKYLKEHNYKVVNSKTLLKMAKEGKNIDKYVSFQIDDSFKSFYKNGFPLFKKFHYPFTLFVYVEGTDKHFGDFMTWKMIKEVRKYGDVQLHSYTHPHLTTLTNEEIIKDTKKAFDIFTKNMGYSPDSYAYPYGEYDKRVQKVLVGFGFKYIYNQNEGGINKNTSFIDVPRIALTGDVDISKRLNLKEMNVKNFKLIRDKNKILKVSAIVPYKKVEVYITKLGWKWIKTKNGYFEYSPNFELKKFRNRVILRYNNEIYIKMVTKVKG